MNLLSLSAAVVARSSSESTRKISSVGVGSKNSAEHSHPIHHLPRSQPAFGLRRQPELCQQGAGVTAQDGDAVVADARDIVSE